MVVVSDTSPITALLQVGCVDLLPGLFARVVIPPAVQAELLREHTHLPDWLEILTPQEIPAALSAARLDAGETEALALALELQANAVLIDERLGRRVAHALGVRVIGVLGCLVLAKERSQLAAVTPIIDELRTGAGCWFDDDLIADVRRAAGEL